MILYMQKSYNRALCCEPLCETLDLKICQQSINSIIFLAMTYFRSSGCAWSFPFDFFPGGGVLPYIGYIGMCSPKGYGFLAVLVINRVSN